MTQPLDRPVRPGADPDPAAGAYGTERPTSGSSVDGSRRAVAPRRKSPLGWLPWAALAAIAAIVLLSLLAINAVDDDGPEGAAGDSLGQVSGSDGSGANGEDASGSAGANGSSGSSGGTGAAAAPALKGGDQDLLAVAASGGLAGLAGQAVTGTGVVESVVSDEGFWVGTSAQDRVFVFLTEQARQSSGESGFQVKAGQTVSITGAVEPLAQEPAVATGVEESEGRAQLDQQAHYVRADAVQLAG